MGQTSQDRAEMALEPEVCAKNESKVSLSELPTHFLIESCTRTVTSLRNEISKQLSQDQVQAQALVQTQDLLQHENQLRREIVLEDPSESGLLNDRRNGRVEVEGQLSQHTHSRARSAATHPPTNTTTTTKASFIKLSSNKLGMQDQVLCSTALGKDSLQASTSSARLSTSRTLLKEKQLKPRRICKSAGAVNRRGMQKVVLEHEADARGQSQSFASLQSQHRTSSTTERLKKEPGCANAKSSSSSRSRKKRGRMCKGKRSGKSIDSCRVDDCKGSSSPREARRGLEADPSALNALGGRSPPLHDRVGVFSSTRQRGETNQTAVGRLSKAEHRRRDTERREDTNSEEQKELKRLIASLPYSFRARVQQSVSQQRSVPVIPSGSDEKRQALKKLVKPQGIPSELSVFHQTSIKKHVDRCRKARDLARDRTSRSNGRKGEAWTGKPTVPQPFRLRTGYRRSSNERPEDESSVASSSRGETSFCACESGSLSGRSSDYSCARTDDTRWKDRVLQEIQQLQQCVQGLSKQQQVGAVAVPLRHTRHRKVVIDVDEVEWNSDSESVSHNSQPETQEDPETLHIFRTPEEIEAYVKQAIRYE